jgi:excisionase family DNA binding protein
VAITQVFKERQAAEALGVSVRTLQRWRVEGRGPHYRKLGKLVAYAEQDLAEFLEECRRHSTSEPVPSLA